MSLKEFSKYAGGLLLAGLLLWWVFRDVDPADLFAQLRRASIPGLLLCAVINIVQNVFRVWRWRALLAPIREDVAFRPMFASVILGYLTTWVVPGRLGELVRPMLLAGRTGMPLGPCIGTVVADRLLDVASVVTLFAFGVWITPLGGEAAEYTALVRGGAIALVGGVIVALSMMLVASSHRGALGKWLDQRPKPVRWVGRVVLSLSTGVDALRSPRLLPRIVIYSLLTWLTIALATWVGVRSAGAEVTLGAVMIILLMLMVGVAVPTPGGAGSYHGAMKVGLMLFGVSQVEAVSAGLLMHLAITVPLILLGVLMLWIEKISWSELVTSARQLKHLDQDHDAPSTGLEKAVEGPA